MNSVNIIGRVVNDPQDKSTENYSMVLFSLAFNPNKETCYFFNSVVYSANLAKAVMEYIHKGDRIGISGTLCQSKYKDKQGNERLNTYINVRQIDFLNTPNTETNKDTSSSTTYNHFDEINF